MQGISTVWKLATSFLFNSLYDHTYCQEEEEAAVRKKRPGLSQGLIPSKKAMMFHKKVYK